MILFIIGYISIHKLEYDKYRDYRIEVPYPTHIAALNRVEKDLRKYVLGYYPYWVGTWYNSLHYDLLNHIAYFAVDLHQDGSIGSIPNPSILANLTNIAHQNGVGVSITATNFSQSEINAFLNSPAARNAAINNLRNLVNSNSLDGVNIDFEFPSSQVRDSLVIFMNDLHNAIHNQNPLHIVTMASPAVDWWGSFDYQALSNVTDGLFIMGYNYYYSGSTYAGPVAPLVSSTLWGTYSVTWTVNDYLSKGADSTKVILGVPYYGYRWPTVSGDLKSQTTGNGVAFVYATLADSAQKYGKMWEDYSKTVWYRKNVGGWYQAWFDDSASLYLKYKLVIDSLLGGAGMWALGYDRDKTELWGALEEAFGKKRRDADFVYYDIPDTMVINETIKVQITVENIGNIIWPDSGTDNPYRLGAGTLVNGNPHNNQFPWFNFDFGGYSNGVTDQRAFLGDTVLVDSSFTLSFDISAPSNVGLYWFEARMVFEGIEWFGPPFSHPVQVIAPGISEYYEKQETEDEEAIYDILGRRIKKAIKTGIYFRRKGRDTEKVIIIK